MKGVVVDQTVPVEARRKMLARTTELPVKQPKLGYNIIFLARGDHRPHSRAVGRACDECLPDPAFHAVLTALPEGHKLEVLEEINDRMEPRRGRLRKLKDGYRWSVRTHPRDIPPTDEGAYKMAKSHLSDALVALTAVLSRADG